MKKKIIMHILNSKSFSGAENVVIQIINNCSSNNVQHIYVSPEGSISDLLDEYNITYHPIKTSSVFEYSRIISTHRPDIIHAHDFTTSVLVALSLKRIPIISHLHHNADWLGRLNGKSLLYYLVSSRFLKILSVSDSVIDDYYFGKHVSFKALTVGNPCSVALIENKIQRNHIDEEYDLAFFGRLAEEKNPFLFIKIVSLIYEKDKKITACMVGTGDLLEKCKVLINELKLGDVVTMYGHVQEPHDIINKSKIVVVTSKWEGFGLSAFESLALGKPVVAANVGGLKNLIDNKSGFLCNSIEQYINSIKLIRSSNDIYDNYSAGAKLRAIELDNSDFYYDRLMELYDSLI